MRTFMRPVTDAVRTGIALAIIAVAISNGCSPATTDVGTDTTTTGGDHPLTDQARISALDAISTKAGALTGASVDARRAELLAYLRSRSEISEAGESNDGGLWALFKDGRPLVIIANQSGQDFGNEVHLRSGLSLTPTAGSPVVATLPGAVQARVLLGGNKTLVQSENPELVAMLQKRNYNVVGSGLAEIDELKTVQGDGVFYFRGHGGSGYTADHRTMYAPMSATSVSLANDIKYRADWDSLRLAYTVPITNSYLPSLDVPPYAHYAFTYQFVLKYFSFAPGSIVYMSACGSAEDTHPEFAQAFLVKGAGGYWGWDGSFNDGSDNIASAYIFDRLLGLNTTSDPNVPPESPKQRPFDSQSIKDDMQARKHYDEIKNGSVELVYIPGNDPAGPLVPSIKYMDVDETTKTLILSGQFGDDQPEVRINGAPQTLRSWNKNEIHVELKDTGASSAGNVVVISKGRTSNTRVLSEWRPTFNLQFIALEGTKKWEGPLRLHFRADVAPYREEAGETPRYRTVDFALSQDADGDITASGSEGTNLWTGTAHVVNRLAFPQAINVMDGIGEIETRTPAMRMFFEVTVLDGLLAKQPGEPDVILPVVWAYEDDVLTTSPFLPAMFVDLNSNFGIIGSQRREAPTTPSAFLYWPNTDAKYATPDTTPRLVAPRVWGSDGKRVADPPGRYRRPIR